MARISCLAAVVSCGTLAASASWAACTAEQAAGLRASGFAADEVVRLCAALLPPESGSDAAAFAGTDGIPFTGAGLEPELGDDGTWRKYLNGGSYVLQNKSDAGSGYILLTGETGAGWRTFDVKVRFTHEQPHLGQGLAGPALVYESGPAADDLILFTLWADGTVAATRGRGDGSFVALASRQDASLVVPDLAYVELGVRKRGDGTTEFLVNDRSTGLTAPHPTDGGRYGLAVFGVGSYEFRDFARSAS